MGKLRVEPKQQQMSPSRYRELLDVLHQGQRLVTDAHLYYDMDDNENPASVKKEFAYVAEKEGLTIRLRRGHGSRSFQIIFESAPNQKNRLNAVQSRERILQVLAQANAPMGKSDILEATGVNTSSWNLRVTELLKEGKVLRQGFRREAVYTLA